MPVRRSGLWWSGDPTVKPPFGAAEIDWGHPLANGIVQAQLCQVNGVLDLNLANPAQNLINVATTATLDTLGLVAAGAQGLERGAAPVSAQPFTMATRCAFTTAGVNLTAVSMGNSVTASRYAAIYRNSGNNIIFEISGDATATVTLGASADAARHVCIGISIAQNNHVGFLDGVKSTSVTGTGVLSFNTTDLLVLNFGGTLVNAMVGSVEYFFIWSVAFNDGQASWLTAEPYAMLRPIVRRRYFVPAGGAAVHMEAIESFAASRVERRYV